MKNKVPFMHCNDLYTRLKNKLVHMTYRKIIKNNLVFVFFATLVVLLFFYQYLSSGSKIITGDFDYSSQAYEAFRISVLHYHQFPLWNPWIAGGVPLFENAQFGLFSLQSLLVLPFGAVYGLKLSYIIYAVLGFWGMYAVSRKILVSSKIRSLLVSYIWIFCGFFAGHNISHYTFSSYFLLPWLLYFIYKKKNKWAWLGLGLTESVIILSSVHYAFLMTALVVFIYFGLSVMDWRVFKKRSGIKKLLLSPREDIIFAAKTLGFIIVTSGYRFITTYYFVSHNERSQGLISEPPIRPSVIFQSLFSPVGTLSKPPNTLWGWGEYSMYIGMGTGFALLIIIITVVIKRRSVDKTFFSSPIFVISFLFIGLSAAALAIGDFGRYSPFHILHTLPGFAQTRVSARWLIFTVFSVLILLGSWRKNNKLINILLFVSVVELFFTFGPPRVSGQNEYSLPMASYSTNFSQYDNGKQHLDSDVNPMHSYFYTTSLNIGQVYADDSLVDTLHETKTTSRCGQNINPNCTLVLSNNASIKYWSPNEITIIRSAEGPISLNMNVDAGWQVNGIYPFYGFRDLDPSRLFILTGDQKTYRLEYAPKLSPSWIVWRLHKL